MTNQEILTIYESVADLTDRMLAAARAGDWERLAALESDCSSRVDMLRRNEAPRQPLSDEARARKAKIIRKILADDREIRTITEPWMAQLSALMNSAGVERKLLRAYDPGR